ncbi:hypothetical protein WR25_25543 isoform A [Diploscapter pachys]|uniref:Kinesin-like protein n=1 Tax=Diploscapter pachys TaxID=2018661 RepID=A0A2A2JFT7_9BILA|nr:hypothetical protein WR25_25543 isoform A [Diploscapter pachys]
MQRRANPPTRSAAAAATPLIAKIAGRATVAATPLTAKIASRANATGTKNNTPASRSAANIAPATTTIRSGQATRSTSRSRQTPTATLRGRPPTSQATRASTTQTQLAEAIEKLRKKEDELGVANWTITELKQKLAEAEELSEVRLKKNVELESVVRHLHDENVNLKGKIRVQLRFRPLAKDEMLTNQLAIHTDNSITWQLAGRKEPKSAAFQHIFKDSDTQLDVFDQVKDLIASVVHGYNVAIFAYGQTGSGKTHTMRGSVQQPGIIPNAFQMLFDMKNALQDIGYEISYSASFVEVYNEAIYDLLATNRTKLTMSDHVREQFIRMPIDEMQAINNFLRKADAKRTTAATKHNEESSRSHAICLLFVNSSNKFSGTSTSSTLSLVDLAGSERIDTGLHHKHLLAEEGKKINTSLLHLKNVLRDIRSNVGLYKIDKIFNLSPTLAISIFKFRYAPLSLKLKSMLKKLF